MDGLWKLPLNMSVVLRKGDWRTASNHLGGNDTLMKRFRFERYTEFKKGTEATKYLAPLTLVEWSD